MKIECKCGEVVRDTEATQKYRLMTTANWTKLLDTVDSSIEGITNDSMKDDAIMKIRYAEKSNQVWECPRCSRLIIINDGEVRYFKPETA
jgi:hypothetical protein